MKHRFAAILNATISNNNQTHTAMYKNFDKDTLSISLRRLTTQDNKIVLHIESDYSHSARKAQLHVNEKDLTEKVERTWKSIKTKKMQYMNVWFGEIDWYDDEVDVYETPMVNIKRGLKRAKIEHKRHGSIPKDWSFNVGITLTDTTTSTPVMEILNAVLYSLFTKDIEKQFAKELKSFLRKEKDNMNYSFPVEDKPYVAPRWF
jgi:hypothetical protein